MTDGMAKNWVLLDQETQSWGRAGLLADHPALAALATAATRWHAIARIYTEVMRHSLKDFSRLPPLQAIQEICSRRDDGAWTSTWATATTPHALRVLVPRLLRTAPFGVDLMHHTWRLPDHLTNRLIEMEVASSALADRIEGRGRVSVERPRSTPASPRPA